MSDSTFATRVEHPVKLPSKQVLSRSIRGLKKGIKSEINKEKRQQMKDIKRELQWLKDQL